MSEIKLYIGDEYLDLSDAKSIPLNIQTQTIFKPAEVKGNFSRSFDIPRTDRNCRILQFAYDYTIDSDFPYQKIDATLVVDGVEFSKGYVIVENNGLSEKEIKLTFYNGNSYFFNIINNLKLRDCKGFGLASHFWNDDYIIDSFTNPHYVYALVDYTDDVNYFKEDSNEVYTSRLLPCLYANLYRYAIEKETGYKFVGEIFQSDEFTKMIFPFSKSKLERRIEDAESRINCDLEYQLQRQYPANPNPQRLELLQWDSIKNKVHSNATYTKYGNDNLVGYSGELTSGLYTESQGSLFFPDYTWSEFEMEFRFTTSAIMNLQFFIGDETLPYKTTLSSNVNIDTSSLTYSLINSKTGIAVLPNNTFGNIMRWTNLPQSYNNNPNINFDYIFTIKFKFITGLHKSIGISFNNSAQLYGYYTKTKVRFVEHIAKDDLKNVYHISAMNWLNSVVYGGKNVKVRLGAGGQYLYELISDTIPSLNESPILASSSSVWNYLGDLFSANPPDSNIPLILEEKDEDYYRVVFGGRAFETTKSNSIYTIAKGWITGSDLVPDQNVGWWIKGIANYFGCFIDVDDDNKEVRFKSWEEIYADIPNAYDYSNKVVNHKSSFWTSRNEGVGQTSYLKFTNSDFVTSDFGNASITIADNSIPIEQTIIQIPFSASETNLRFNKNLYVPLVKKFSGGTDYNGIVGTSSQQHILLVDNTASTFGDIIFQCREILTYDLSPLGNAHYEINPLTWNMNVPFSYFNDNTKAIQLGFDSYMLYNYHRWLNYVFDNFKVLTCYMKLSPTDVNTIDKLKPIYINYYNSTFLLNRIYDWVNGEICKVELLKLN